MGRKILIICVCILCLAGAIVFVSQTAEPPVETGKVVRDPVTEHCIIISAEYESVEAMHLAASTDGVPEGGYVLISSNVEDPDNAKLYIKGADGYELVTDLSGAKGEQGLQGLPGKQGADGQAGVTPMLKISATTGMWEVSYDLGTTWESLGVQAQGPKGDKGATGATGATGLQGPAYVLTEADKQAIINAVLAQLANGGSGTLPEHPEVMYVYNGEFEPISEPSTTHACLSVCNDCGAWVFNNGEDMYYCYADGCSSMDPSFNTSVNPYRVAEHYYASDVNSTWYESPQGSDYTYVWHSGCGADLHVSDSMSGYIMSCPHCGDSHEAMWGTE